MTHNDTVINQGGQLETFSYDNNIVRQFTWATVVWGIVGFLVGLIIAIRSMFCLSAYAGFWCSMVIIRKITSAAYKCSNFCFCW